MANEVEVVLRLKDGKIVSQYTKAANGIKKQNNKIKTSFKKTEISAKQSMDRIKTQALGMKAAFVGIGAVAGGLVVRAFLKAGSEVEDLTTQFKVLLGSVGDAKKRMAELALFAQTTPFQLQQVAEASRVLQVLTGGVLATGESLRMVGDAAAASGAEFKEVAMWVGRAYAALQAGAPIGEASMRLLELGLITAETKLRLSELNKEGRTKDAWALLKSELDKTKGGMEELSKTVTGLTSTIKDQLQAGMRQILDSGVWDMLRDKLGDIVKKMNEAIDSGVFKKWGDHLKTIAENMDLLISAGKLFIAVWSAKKIAAITLALSDMALKLVAMNPIIMALVGVYAALEYHTKLANDKTKELNDTVEQLSNSKVVDTAAALAREYQDIAVSAENMEDRLWGLEDYKAARLEMKAIKEEYEKLGPLAQTYSITAKDTVRRLEEQKIALIQISGAQKEIKKEQDKPLPPPKISPLKKDSSANAALKIQQDAHVKTHELYKKRLKDGQAFELMQLQGEQRMKDEAIRTAKERADGIEKIEKDSIERRQAMQNTILSGASNLASSLGNLAQVRAQNELKMAKAAGASEQEMDSIRKAAFEKQKKFSLLSAVINTAQAVTSGLATVPFVPLGVIAAATAAAAGAVQIGAISAQKLNKGGFVQGVGDRDTVPAMLTPGEFVVPKGASIGNTFSPTIIINNSTDPDRTAAMVGETVEEKLRDFAESQRETSAMLL